MAASEKSTGLSDEERQAMAEGARWLFGYGSILWKNDEVKSRFPVRMAGLRGYKRRFWQGSPDHRGTPEAPGRTVTLLPVDVLREKDPHCAEEEDDALVHGAATLVEKKDHGDVFGVLDHREKAGYERRDIKVELDDGSMLEAVTYVATHTNEHFLGPSSSIDEVAQHISRSEGPSGPNWEYLRNLALHLKKRGVRDAHVEALWDRVEKLVSSG